MNSSKFRFTLDLHSIQSQYSIPVMMGDTSVTLLISITDGGVPYIISDGCLAKLSIKRPTGTYLEEFCTIRNNAIIEYPFSRNENTCAVDGIHECDITLYGPDGGKVGGPRFTMVVSKKVVNSDDLVIEDDFSTWVDAMLRAEGDRQFQETKRVKAEEERVDAEAKRVEAEAKRSKTSEYAERAENAANRVESYGEKIISNEKRITNLEYGKPFVSHRGTVAQCSVPTNALPYATINAVGGRTTAIKSMSDNLLFGFKRADESKFVQSINDEGALALLVNGSQNASTGDSYYSYKEMVGTLPAGRYSLTWTADTPIEDPVFDVIAFSAGGPTGGERLSNNFELNQETTIFLQIVLSEISDQIIYPVIADVNGEMMVERDRYEVPEEIVAKDGWESGLTRLFLQDGTYFNNNTKEYTDVRDIVGNDYHILVAPGGKLLFESTNGNPVYSNIIFTTKVLGGDS